MEKSRDTGYVESLKLIPQNVSSANSTHTVVCTQGLFAELLWFFVIG